jgi:hypothetical protein
MPEDPPVSARRGWWRWYYLVPAVVVGFGIWMAVDAWQVMGRSMVTLPDSTRVVFERVSVGRPVKPLPAGWDPALPCYEHGPVQVEGGRWSERWAELHAKLPAFAQQWLPKPTYKAVEVLPTAVPAFLILHYSGELEGNLEAWLRDGNGFEFKPKCATYRLSSADPQGKLVLDGYLSRRPIYQVVFRPAHDDGNSLAITRLPPVAMLEFANPIPATAPEFAGTSAPMKVAFDGAEFELEKIVRRKTACTDASTGPASASGLWVEFALRRSGEVHKGWDFPPEGFQVADAVGNSLRNEPMISMAREKPRKGHLMYGRGPLLSDDSVLRVTIKGWRTSRDRTLFADDELFRFTGIPGPGSEDKDLSMSAVVRGRELKLVKVTQAMSKLRQGLFVFEGNVAKDERVVIVEAQDDHGRNLLRNFDPLNGQVWTDFCQGGGTELAFNVHLALDASTFSVTMAIVKPGVAEFLLRPEVGE